MAPREHKELASTDGALPALTIPEAVLLIEALRDVLYDTVVQLREAQLRLRKIGQITEK